MPTALSLFQGYSHTHPVNIEAGNDNHNAAEPGVVVVAAVVIYQRKWRKISSNAMENDDSWDLYII